MTDIDPETADLSDSELIELLENHGMGRRTVLTALGIGGLFSVGSGAAAAGHDDPHPPHIDSHFGYAAPADEDLPGKLRPDHRVALRIDFQADIPFQFDPMGIHIDVGDVVRFDAVTPDHTVTAFHLGHGRQQRVPDDAAPFSSPVIPVGGFWLYQFDHPGTYDVYCAPHQLFGMVMRIAVGDLNSAEYDGEFGEEGRPPTSAEELEGFLGVDDWPFPAAAELFGTDAMSVCNIVNNGPVTPSDVAEDL